MTEHLELLRGVRPKPSTTAAHYLIAVLAAVLGLLLQAYINRFLPGPYFFLFFPAAIVISWKFGLRPALLTVGICILGADFLYFEPQFEFSFISRSENIALAFVGFASAFTAWVVSDLERKRYLAMCAQEELGTVLKSIGDAVMVVDRERRVTFLNPIAESLTGWSLNEARGKPVDEVFKIINQETRNPAENPVDRVLREGIVVGLANHTSLIARDEKERAIEDSAAPIVTTSDHQVAGVVLVFRDVTERYAAEAAAKTAEENLEEKTRLLDQIFEEVPAYMVLASYPELKFLRANKAYHALVGHDNVAGKRVIDVLPRFEADGLAAVVKQVAETKERFVGVEIPIALTDAKGKTKTDYFDFVYLPLLDPSGNTYAILGQGTCVTEKVKARQKVEENELRLELATRTAKVGIWDLDLKSGEIEVTDLIYEIFDLPKDEVVTAEKVFAALHPEDSPRVQQRLKESVESRTDYISEFRVQKRDGSIAWVYGHGRATYAKDGTPLRMYGINFDITQRKNFELALETAKEEAVRANELKSSFLANMSHEIRTPLGAMLGFADLLCDPGLSAEERASYAEVLTRNGENLSVIINDILDLSKVEAGHLTLEFMATNPREITEDVISLLGVKAKEKNLTLEYTCESSTPNAIISDPVRLRQILINLVGNAVKFTSAGSVKVRSFASRSNSGRDMIGFEITDTGIGIPKTQQNDVFEVFVQADSSMTRKFGGTGLGLALSKKLARELGGDIVLLRSEEGKGSAFLLTIEDQPVRKVFATNLKQDRKESGDPGLNALKDIKVLVVDDSPDNRQLIWHYLTKYGASVEFAENGVVGYSRALKESFDVILMDIQMPEMDGYTTTSKLRSEGYQKPIIALTAHAMSEVSQECLKVGCSAHLPKPINSKELVAKVVELTR